MTRLLKRYRPSGKESGLLAAVCIVLAHFFIALGKDSSLLALWSDRLYWQDLPGVWFMATSCFLLVRTGILVSLGNQRQLSFLSFRFLVRLLPLGIILPAIFVLAAQYLYARFIWQQDIRIGSFFQYEYPMAVLVIVFINLIYLLWFYRKPFEEAVSNLTQAGTVITLLAKQGKEQIPVTINQISHIQLISDQLVLHCLDGRQLRIDGTLEQLALKLPLAMFFRANRQVLLGKTACGSFTTERSGRLLLQLKDGSMTIPISQKKARDFRQWLKST